MPEPLWKIRQRKGLTVNQLAAKSGVPAISIQEYEAGRAIRSADLPRLAKALFVEEWDIELKSKPRPKPRKPRPRAERKGEPAKKPRPKAPPPLARPSQITHLLNLVRTNFGMGRSELEAQVGKPLEQMTRQEATQLLKEYQQRLIASRGADASQSAALKRKRAYLPESVDAFELNYLTRHQEAQTLIHFTLFDGQKISGRIIGFSPYSITIRLPDGQDEVTLQKLAIAYYRAQIEEETP